MYQRVRTIAKNFTGHWNKRLLLYAVKLTRIQHQWRSIGHLIIQAIWRKYQHQDSQMKGRCPDWTTHLSLIWIMGHWAAGAPMMLVNKGLLVSSRLLLQVIMICSSIFGVNKFILFLWFDIYRLSLSYTWSDDIYRLSLTH